MHIDVDVPVHAGGRRRMMPAVPVACMMMIAMIVVGLVAARERESEDEDEDKGEDSWFHDRWFYLL